MKMEGPYWVYTHTCPNGMVYVGMSSRKYDTNRWQPNAYKTTSLQPYIEEFGWESIDHFFIDGIQTKESALKLEDELIKMYHEKGCCINQKSSGGLESLDKKLYSKQYREEHKEEIQQYYEEHKEYCKEYQKQYREKNKEKIKERRKKYYEKNKEKIKEKTKQYREEHKEYCKEYQKQYREKHKK